MFRKQKQFVACLAVGALLCSTGVATAQLINGNFDTGDLSGWTDPSNIIGVANASIGAPTPGAQSGDFAARLGLASGVSELTQTFPAAPGDEFNLSGFMLTDSADPEIAGNSFQLLKIVFEDENGTDLVPASVSVGQFSDPAFPGVDSLPFLDSSSGQDNWIFSEAQGVAPAGTASVTFFVLNVDFGDDDGMGGIIEYPKWVDNLNANNVADGMNLLENADFETGDFTGWVPPFNPNVENAIVGAPKMVGAQDGDFAAQLGIFNGVAELRQTFPAAPGDEFCMEGYMLSETALPFGTVFGLYKIVFQDADGNDLQIDGSLVTEGVAADPANPGVDSRPLLDFSTQPGTWIISRAQGVAPPETTQVVFLALDVDFSGFENFMWFDNLKAANVADGINLLANPSFETGDFTGWAPEPPSGGEATIGAPTAGAQSGDFAALLTPQDGVGELIQTFPGTPGEEYNINGFMLSEAAIPSGPSFGLYKIVFRNAAGEDLEPASVSIGQFSDPANPGVDSLEFLNDGSMVDIWQFSEAQGVAPEGTVEVLFFILNIDFAGGVNPIWYDTVEAGVVGGMDECDFPLGDVNQDGEANLLDVAPFVTEVTSSNSTSCEADTNEDGSVDLLDVATFVAIVTGG